MKVEAGSRAAERKWFRRSPFELSLRDRLRVFFALWVVCFGILGICGKVDAAAAGFLFALLLVNPVDWIVQGWRESAAGDSELSKATCDAKF